MTVNSTVGPDGDGGEDGDPLKSSPDNGHSVDPRVHGAISGIWETSLVVVHSDLLRKLLNWTHLGSLGGPKEVQGVAVAGILVVGTPPDAAVVAAADDDLDLDDGEGARS